MRYAQLGSTGISLPRIVFGAGVISGWGDIDDDTAIRTIHASIDAGANAIDTAPVYGFGRCERVVGQAIRDRRTDAIVLAKCGLRWDGEFGVVSFEATLEDGRSIVIRRDLRPESIRQEVDGVLARLGVDFLDLIQLHWPDPLTPLAETMGALIELRKAGNIGAIGVSNFDMAALVSARAALGREPCVSVQPKYNLVDRSIECDLLPYCEREGIAVLAYSPLERSLLTGRVTEEREFGRADSRSRRPDFQLERRAAINAILATSVAPIARRHGVTVGQIAIAWVLAQPGVTSAIVGARTPEQARANAAAADIELALDEVSTLALAFESVAVGS